MFVFACDAAMTKCVSADARIHKKQFWQDVNRAEIGKTNKVEQSVPGFLVRDSNEN